MATARTAEELRAEIEAARRQIAAERARRQELKAETAQAAERQRLRMELDFARQRLEMEQQENQREAERRRSLDEDQSSWLSFVESSDLGRPGGEYIRPQTVLLASGGNSTDCAKQVAKGEYVWRITGYSWLKGMIEQDDQEYLVQSEVFHLGDETFVFCCNPWASELCQDYHGSLAIVLSTDARVMLRYRIYVKARNGEFLQWGETRDVVHRGHPNRWAAYGPDVHWPGHPPASPGIFGLSHEELLQSEWVENDTLTVKFELEVRPDRWADSVPFSLVGEVPQPTMTGDTRALLEEGKFSDVRFMVQDQVIHAHSQILCARSEVFSKQLTGGMQESMSKVIVIEDCDVATFNAFLQFLYTDQLPDAKELLPKGASGEPQNDSGNPNLSGIQALLAVSDKYQVKRLQLWCEAKLSEEINASQVCGILCQAHLLQAKPLETACLSFIKDHMSQVLTTPSYIELVKKWPQLALKVSLFSAGVSEAEALATIDELVKPQEQPSAEQTADSRR
ncbi:BPM2 [Symbiodinium sp. CCMP2592]|nr:BPM2 [Symbiodinium sp. CCMP2592]